MARLAYRALDERKGFHIRILDLKDISDLADYFVIADGTNRSQIQAMCDRVEEKLHLAGYERKSIEGNAQGGWILLDYYDIIVHIFSDEARRFYEIERIWNDADEVTQTLMSLPEQSS